MSIIGYMRSPLIPSSLHLCQTLGEKGGTKRGCGGMEAEVKEEAGGGEERERASEGGMGKDATRRAKKRAGSASFLKQLRPGWDSLL